MLRESLRILREICLVHKITRKVHKIIRIRPDTRPISSRLRVGRGSNADGQGQFEGGRGLYFGRAGAVMVVNRFSSQFRVD